MTAIALAGEQGYWCPVNNRPICECNGIDLLHVLEAARAHRLVLQLLFATLQSARGNMTSLPVRAVCPTALLLSMLMESLSAVSRLKWSVAVLAHSYLLYGERAIKMLVRHHQCALLCQQSCHPMYALACVHLHIPLCVQAVQA